MTLFHHMCLYSVTEMLAVTLFSCVLQTGLFQEICIVLPGGFSKAVLTSVLSSKRLYLLKLLALNTREKKNKCSIDLHQRAEVSKLRFIKTKAGTGCDGKLLGQRATTLPSHKPNLLEQSYPYILPLDLFCSQKNSSK